MDDVIFTSSFFVSSIWIGLLLTKAVIAVGQKLVLSTCFELISVPAIKLP